MGRAEFYNPVTSKREPIKAGSIVNDSGLEYTPDQIKGIDNKINNLSTDVETHKAEKATQDGYGHIRLQDIPNPEIATQIEAETGTNNTKMMTPLRVANAIDSKIDVVDAMHVRLYVGGEQFLFRKMPHIYTWAEVQQIVRQGLACEYFNIGDQLISTYDDGTIIWEVIGIDVDAPADSNFTHSMTIQTKNCLHDIQFDAREPDNPNSNIKINGSSRYTHSAVRQWLNSDELKFTWVSKHSYDAEPNDSLRLYNGAGFLYRLDPELVSVLGIVNKQVAKYDSDTGQERFSDKVFLLSQYEVDLGTTNAGDVTGEFIYPYYEGKGDADRIKTLDGSPRAWWLRSARVPYNHYVRYVYASGAAGYDSAYYAYGLSPACVII